ncbi:hypothetical protein RED65_01868 [Oceanobacter sp. RED65]|uniref:Uncharacterized protein n=1 Tax=Bermanella marisrubri TaxID=207949 RepID=Q1MXI8_9GAMM|nr:hypothetical protein RED65_01868 [Oceanobacter sp. RED65] [Bermanella marisrubri]
MRHRRACFSSLTTRFEDRVQRPLRGKPTKKAASAGSWAQSRKAGGQAVRSTAQTVARVNFE